MCKAKILIAEDEALVAEALRISLEFNGYRVVSVTVTGEDTVEYVGNHYVDLLIMDISLEGMVNGIEAASIIGKKRIVPIVFLSGYHDQTIIQKAKITEPYEFLAKPAEEWEILKSVETALAKAKDVIK